MPALDITPLNREILKGVQSVMRDYKLKFLYEARDNAPVLTGELKSGFAAIDDGPSRRNWAGEEQFYDRLRITNRVRYSIFQETGSVKNIAKRFMRRAFLRHSLAFAAEAESVALEIVNKFNSRVS